MISCSRNLEEREFGTSVLKYLPEKYSSEETRPKIYTMISNRDVVSTFENDEILIIWSEAWAQAGFEPCILTYDDAASHPNFDEFLDKLKAENLEESKWGRYLRYAAMSNLGGGWYSEPYILPLSQKLAKDAGFDLPNIGRFTMYQSKMPELLSGSQAEWDKMAFVMTERISSNDSTILQGLKANKPGLFLIDDSIISSIHVLRASESDDMCPVLQSKLAAKFTYKIAKAVGIPRRKYYKSVMSKLASVSKADCNRPIMHTFFQPAYKQYDKLLEELTEWKKSWENAGWRPVVLTLKDAERHPLFPEFEKAFNEAKGEMSDYNRMCFYRWLAMAASNGGWMSDYDTFPLYSKPEESSTLPNKGEFTSFQNHVPALVVGSAAEWDRMSNLLYQSYLKHNHEFWSDMLALKEVHDNDEKSCIFSKPQEVISGDKPYAKLLGGKENIELSDPYSVKKYCHATKGQRAIHFSHAACTRIGFCHNNRGVTLTKWIEAWNEQCAARSKRSFIL